MGILNKQVHLNPGREEILKALGFTIKSYLHPWADGKLPLCKRAYKGTSQVDLIVGSLECELMSFFIRFNGEPGQVFYNTDLMTGLRWMEAYLAVKIPNFHILGGTWES